MMSTVALTSQVYEVGADHVSLVDQEHFISRTP